MTSCCLNVIILDHKHDINNAIEGFINSSSIIQITLRHIIVYIPTTVILSEIEPSIKQACVTHHISHTIIQESFVNYYNVYSLLYSTSKQYGDLSIFIDVAYDMHINKPYTFDIKQRYNYIQQYDNQYSYSILFCIKHTPEPFSNISDIKIREYGILNKKQNYHSHIVLKNTSNQAIQYNYMFLTNSLFKFDILDKLYIDFIQEKYSQVIQSYHTHTQVAQQERRRHHKWVILYICAVSYYNMDNYKQCNLLCAELLKCIPNKIEPLYILSLITASNKNYTQSQELLSMFENKKLNISSSMFNNTDIYNYLVHYQLFIINKLLKDTQHAIDIADWLVCQNIPERLQTELYRYIDNNMLKLEGSVDESAYIYINTSLIYETGYQYYFKLDDKLATLLCQQDKLYLHYDNHNYEIIHDGPIQNFTCINHNNEYILVVLFKSDKMVTYKLTIKEHTLVHLNQYSVPIVEQSYKWASKLINYQNIYIGIVNIEPSFHYLYRLCYLDNTNNKLIGYSNIFKLDAQVKDIFLEDDGLIIISKSSYMKLSLSELYIQYNIPIDYLPTITCTLSETLCLNLNIDDYDASTLTYKNYVIGKDDPIANINIDLKHRIITDINTSQSSMIDKFIYIPPIHKNEVEMIKEYEVVFYTETTDINLLNYLHQQDVSIGSEYQKGKYLIINMMDLHCINLIQLSDVITHNTLIVVLINEDDLNNNVSNFYCENKYLNKLYLFNIVKNTEYIEFIYEKIIQQEQYTIRSEYFDMDKQNIYNQAHPIKYTLRYIKSIKDNIDCYDSHFKKNPYKLELITRLYSKTENLNIIEILKFILYNNQNSTVLYESTVDSLIVKLNILGNTLSLKEVNIPELQNITCVLILNSIENLASLNNIYDSESLIYILDRDQLIYTF
jgi:hypothetical protein